MFKIGDLQQTMWLDDELSDQFENEKKLVDNLDDLQQKVNDISAKVQERELLVKDLEVSIILNRLIFLFKWYQEELNVMTTTVKDFITHQSKSEQDDDNTNMIQSQQNKPSSYLYGLAFHGVEVDQMEKSSSSDEMRRNFLEHTIIKMLRKEWGIFFRGTFQAICR